MALIRLNTRSLPDSAVTTAKVADNAVTTAKVNADAITNAKIADDAIQTENLNSGVNLGRRNIVINGAMQVAQRGTSQTGIGASGGYFTVDRMYIDFIGSAGRLTQSQSTVTDLPGFANALKLDCTTADTSIAAGEIALLQYRIEGQDLQQFKKGTSSAEKFTVSFYVKGNGNATYICELYDNDNARSISQTFSVTSSWTRVVLTYDGDTTGAFGDDNALSLYILFWLHSGSNYNSGTLSTTWSSVTQANRAVGGSSLYSSTDNEFLITGLQLEVGDQATDFEHRSFGETLLLCQRYYRRLNSTSTNAQQIMSGGYHNSTQFQGVFRFEPHMRAAPSLLASTTSSNNSSSAYAVQRSNGIDYIDSFAFHQSSQESVLIYTTGNTSGTEGVAGVLILNNASSVSELAASAEL